MRGCARRDRGQAIVLVLGCVVLMVLLAVATAQFAGRTVVRERAQAAADAAALAGVGGGREAARHLAAANNGVLVSYAQWGPAGQVTVQVTVRVGDAVATARATRAP